MPRHKQAAVGGFRKSVIRGWTREQLQEAINSFDLAVVTSKDGPAYRTEVMQRYGVTDFNKARKQLHQEGRRRNQMADHAKQREISAKTWRPLERATNVFDQKRLDGLKKSMVGKKIGDQVVTEEMVEAHYRQATETETWMNHKYTVQVRREEAMTHLSIRRNDRQVCRDWRDFQRIKNQLCGEECEGVELFPAQSRVVDSANQYHLWVVNDPTFRFEIGWQESFIVDASETDDDSDVVQRAFDQ